MSAEWDEVTRPIEAPSAAAERIEALFPGRKFTLDGPLVGGIGEVVAAYMFNLELAPGRSYGHDALAPDGRQVEVKLTQGASVAVRHDPAHLIVLSR